MTVEIQGPVGAQTRIAGRLFDTFSGTGYLGLQNPPAVLTAVEDALRAFGFSTGAPRGGWGEHPLYQRLEGAASRFFGTEAVVTVASGYLAMSVLTQATCNSFDHIFIDAAAHHSLWDAAYATNLPISPFHHLRPEALEEALRRELQAGERPLVLSDGVFPVSGEIAPLPDYWALARAYHGLVYLDDAHAVGVLGPHGRGTVEYYGVQDEGCHTVGTLAKALGGFGGVLWGDRRWAHHIERNSRICAGASPIPLVAAAASAAALEVALAQPELRERLQCNVRLARQGFHDLGWEISELPTPIVCLPARGEQPLEHIRDALMQAGIAVTVVRSYPSTPPGGALRVAIFATHTPEQIQRLISETGRILRA
jgi:8-amino-7-oxononanoate synthase